MKLTHYHTMTALCMTAVALMLTTACSEEKGGAAYARLPEVPKADVSAPGAGASSAGQGQPSPHGSDPHAGLFHSTAGNAHSTTAPALGAGAGIQIEPPTGVEVRAGGNILEAAGVAFTVPEGWKQEQPTSNLRLAQYSIPGEAGAADLVLFYFGKGQGGGVQQNVQRWAAQFRSDDPTTAALGADVAEFENGGLRIALVKTSGTYDPGSMTSAPPPPPQPNSALFGLVVEGGPEGSLFVKVTGPKATIEAQNANLEAFAQSARQSTFK